MKALVLVLIVVVVVSAYFYYDFSPADTPTEVPVVEIEEISKTPLPPTTAPAQIAVFENSDYNFTFNYRIKPYGYSMFENTLDQNIDMGTLFGVTLMRSDDYNAVVKAAAEGNAMDGPPSMSVYVYSASKITDLEAWLIDNKMITNCMDGEVTNTMLAGNDAKSCLWDGLYPGVTVAQISDNKIYLLVGTRESMETEGGFSYEKDFNELVTTFTITP
ncbi:hypothetical protein K2P47_01835 [Patescibacteria group bacterium]|nr:hypothetical protein [Patescibacteria group bacterium]